MIPNDAIGLMSYENENPLQFLNDTEQQHLYDILEKTDGLMTLRVKLATALSAPNYLGAIVSSDRQTVYWVNDTKPLP